MRWILSAVLILVGRSAYANPAIMEGISASSNTVYVDTVAIRIDIGTITYAGGVPGVVLFASSNVVVSSGTGGNNFLVFYSTGSIEAASLDANSGGIGHWSRTIAQLLAIAVRAGTQYFCSDCSPSKMVVSTGTSAGNFADPAGGAFK